MKIHKIIYTIYETISLLEEVYEETEDEQAREVIDAVTADLQNVVDNLRIIPSN